MYCSGSKSAVVWFKYEGENWQSFKSYNPPISYRLESEKGQCDTVYYLYARYISKNRSSGGCENYQYARAEVSGKISTFNPYIQSWWWAIRNDDGRSFPFRYISNADENNYKSNGVSRYTAYHPPTQNCYNSTGSPRGHSMQIIAIDRKDGQLDNCGKCKFEILDKNNQIIYSRLEDNCPQVQIECDDKCPENTHCECNCGRYKCCYGKDGHIIKRIKL